MKFFKFFYIAPVALLMLAGCGGNPPPQVFAPLNYAYLPPIVLKVASITVQNDYVPDPGAATLIGQAPEAPANALTDMANHRLVANGTPGTATFTVETASLDQTGATITGTMTVRLDVASADGRSTGFTEASASYSEAAPDPNSSQNKVQAVLYDVTKNLMDTMNVQLQYQVQRNLGSWIAYAPNAAAAPLGAGAAAGGAIQAAPLPSPGSNPVPSLGPGAVPTSIPPAAPTL